MEEVIKKAIEGDTDAFEKLVYEYERQVYSLAYRMFNNNEDAKDVSQEVFIKIYRNIGKYQGSSSFKTWVYTICYNTCIDELRKRKKVKLESMDKMIEGEENEFERQFVSDEPTPEEKLITKENMSAVERAINKLNDEHKAIITLRDIKGLSYGEIVEITQLSQGTVKSRISRARKSLRELISAEQNMD